MRNGNIGDSIRNKGSFQCRHVRDMICTVYSDIAMSIHNGEVPGNIRARDATLQCKSNDSANTWAAHLWVQKNGNRRNAQPPSDNELCEYSKTNIEIRL